MAHIHKVYDNDVHFKIDAVTRAVKNASETKVMIVQHDHNSERFTFEIPRIVDGHDMSTCNVVQVHYINIDSTNKHIKYTGIYEVDDLQVSPDDDGIVICSWLISGNATQCVGKLSFIVRFVCSTDGNVDYAWNTAVHSNVFVTAGIYNGQAVVEEYADVLEQWKQELIDSGGVSDEKIAQVVEEYMAENLDSSVRTVNGIEPDENGNVDTTAPTDEQIAQAVSGYLDEHPEATTTVQDDSITEEKLTADVRAKLNSSAGGGYIMGNTTQAEGSASFAEMFQKVKNEVMLDYMGNINKIPVIAHTDQHGALNGSASIVGVFKTIADLVNWNDVSKVINLGDCVVNAWKDASDIPWLACTELEKVVTTQAPIPLEKQLNVFGNHDQFTWDSSKNTYGAQMENQAPLQQYFRNINAHRRSNNGWFTVEDGYFNVKYVVTSAYEGTGKFATTEQFDFMISELGKDDGYDIVLIAHEMYNPDYIGRVFPTTSDMITKGSAENDNNHGMGLDVGAILTARRNKTAGTFTDGSGVVHAFDFSNCKTELLCSLHGHTHYETYNYVNDNYLNVALSPMTFGNRWMFFCLIDRENQMLKVWKMPTASATEYHYEKYEIPFDVSDRESFTIKNKLLNCTVFNTSTTIKEGQPYSQYVKAKSGYSRGDVLVTMGDTDVTADCYDATTGLIHIESVSGDVIVKAVDSTGDISQNFYTVTANFGDNTGYVSKAPGGAFTLQNTVVGDDGSYTISGMKAKPGYLPGLSVVMGGEDITHDVATWNRSTVTANISPVTDDVVITMNATPVEYTQTIINADGTEEESAEWYTSEYLDVSMYKSIVVWDAEMSAVGIALYDENRNFITKLYGISGKSGVIYTETDVKFVRIVAASIQCAIVDNKDSAPIANVTVNAPDTVRVDGIAETVKYGNNLALTVTDLTGYEDIEISATVTVGDTEMKFDIENGILTVPYITGDVVVNIKSVRPLLYELTEELTLSGDGKTVDTGVNPMSSLDDSFTILIDYTPNTPPNESVIFNNNRTVWNKGIHLRKYTGTNTDLKYTSLNKTISGINANTDRCKMALTHVGGSDSYVMNYVANTPTLGEPVVGEITNGGGSTGQYRVCADTIVIGGANGTWKGTIHAFQIWNKVLTDEEITEFVKFE